MNFHMCREHGHGSKCKRHHGKHRKRHHCRRVSEFHPEDAFEFYPLEGGQHPGENDTYYPLPYPSPFHQPQTGAPWQASPYPEQNTGMMDYPMTFGNNTGMIHNPPAKRAYYPQVLGGAHENFNFRGYDYHNQKSSPHADMFHGFNGGRKRRHHESTCNHCRTCSMTSLASQSSQCQPDLPVCTEMANKPIPSYGDSCHPFVTISYLPGNTSAGESNFNPPNFRKCSCRECSASPIVCSFSQCLDSTCIEPNENSNSHPIFFTCEEHLPQCSSSLDHIFSSFCGSNTKKDDQPSIKENEDDQPSIKENKDDQPSIKENKDDQPRKKEKKDDQPSKKEKKGVQPDWEEKKDDHTDWKGEVEKITLKRKRTRFVEGSETIIENVNWKQTAAQIAALKKSYASSLSSEEDSIIAMSVESKVLI